MNAIRKVSLVFFAVLFLASCEHKDAEMTFSESEYDFGTINQGDKVVHDFKFTNTGKADLLISKAKGSCGCTVPEYPKEAIKSGESGTIKVSFNSTGKHGETQKTVTLFCNTKDSIEILKIKATIEVPEKAK
ncbi:DUF1573 domain-containing protein [Flavobacterium wongokense]|uniref:DUF1573 domain-containing protein n=1 Tax=Flavobacterium wongokense TaxID=2910674 RepID=UPI001F2AD447|nr:DUF1573 domain-containing protein [Flavobacterium sp. WG47]MCF6132919.1 DUF1573 domain-containing protein [Flavobacterium sp. WG47]